MLRSELTKEKKQKRGRLSDQVVGLIRADLYITEHELHLHIIDLHI